MSKTILSVFLLFFINFCFGQVAVPERFSVSIIPNVEIDISSISEEDLNDPLSTLSDTSLVNVQVLFLLPEASEGITDVEFQIGSGGIPGNLFDETFSLFGVVDPIYQKEFNNGFYSFHLGTFEYNGGLEIRMRLKDDEGAYSVYVED